jgi:hypothetical protein
VVFQRSHERCEFKGSPPHSDMAAAAGKSRQGEEAFRLKAEKQILAIDIGDVICVNTKGHWRPKAERQGGAFSKTPHTPLKQIQFKKEGGELDDKANCYIAQILDLYFLSETKVNSTTW